MTDSLQLLTCSGQTSFTLDLHNAVPLMVDEIVRRVPNKRLVCRGVWNHQQVYAKIFIGDGAERYAARDMHGVRLLQQADISTPDLVHAGALAGQPGMVLVFTAVDNSLSVEQAYQGLAPVSRFGLAKLLVSEVAHHHQAGLLQTDLYLKNFLVQDNKVYTLDGDGIRRLSSLFQKRQRLRNLATLFSKMDVLDDGRIQELYACYCQQLHTLYLPEDAAQVWHLTQKIRRQVAAAYADKKVFRTCTDVKIRKNFRHFAAIARDFELDDIAPASLDAKLADTGSNLKNGNTCTIAKTTMAGRQVVVKRYNIKNVWHGLSRAFRPSRAARSWANAYRLIISGIATHKPLALLEERVGWLRRRAYFLSEYIDAPDVHQYLAQSTDRAGKEAIMHELARLFYRLYLLRVTHGDCKASNIKIVDGLPVLIDLDAMQAHSLHWLTASWFNYMHVRDLKRLMKNWSGDTELSGMLRQAFLRQYLEPSLHEPGGILSRAGLR